MFYSVCVILGVIYIIILPSLCKIKGVFDYYFVMNNWHWRLLVLIFGIYSQSGFGDDWISQVNIQVLL